MKTHPFIPDVSDEPCPVQYKYFKRCPYVHTVAGIQHVFMNGLGGIWYSSPLLCTERML